MKILIAILCFFLVSACGSNIPLQRGFAKNNGNLTASNTKIQYSNDTLIIFFDKDIGDKDLLEAVGKMKAEILYRYTMMQGIAIRLPKGSKLDDCITFFNNVKGVTNVERDYISEPQ